VQALFLSIGARTYMLAPGLDRAKLERKLVNAARHGGGMVDIPAAGRRSFRALVTPGLSVTFETKELADETDAAGPLQRTRHALIDEFDGDFA
jgi:hypothetical protein